MESEVLGKATTEEKAKSWWDEPAPAWTPYFFVGVAAGSIGIYASSFALGFGVGAALFALILAIKSR